MSGTARRPSPALLREPGEPPVVFGHRGLSSRAPENTLAAFRLLPEHGVTGVELDIHQCASGELVVAHDNDLLRTAGVPLRLRQASFAEIREHDVGSWFDARFAGERVPALSEVFELLGRGMLYDIEVKPYGVRLGRAISGQVEFTLMELLRVHGLADRCIVSSFDPLVVRRWNALATAVPAALIYANGPDAPFTVRRGRGRMVCRPAALKPHWVDVTARYVRRRHRYGRAVIPWTVDDPETAALLAGMEVDGIISNCPEEIARAVAHAMGQAGA